VVNSSVSLSANSEDRFDIILLFEPNLELSSAEGFRGKSIGVLPILMMYFFLAQSYSHISL